jgi:c-src tyrosine kinase
MTLHTFCYCRWFHGKIERKKSEELLNPREDGHDGLFLIRESVNYPGDFTLSVCHQKKVEHYRIIYHRNQMTIDEETYFDNLNQLVEVFCLLFI